MVPTSKLLDLDKIRVKKKVDYKDIWGMDKQEAVLAYSKVEESLIIIVDIVYLVNV